MLLRASLCRSVCSWMRSAHGLAVPETCSKIYRARVNTLLFSADRLLLTPRADTLESYLMARISDDKFYNAYRATAFMRLIRFCLERHMFGVALALHDRMRNEGFFPVHALSLRMTALSIIRQITDIKEILPPLREIFEKSAYDVSAFMDLIRYLTDSKPAPGSLVDDIARAFVSIRQIKLSEYPDLVGELASINMRIGRLDAAQQWLQSFEDACGSQRISPDVTPYSDIISTLGDIDPKNGEAVQDVLVRMRAAGVSPNTNVFNALIRVNFLQGRYQEAFSLYHVLMGKRSDDLMPNDITYKLLFRATYLLNQPRIIRRHNLPDNAVSPRRLFQEMLTCHFEQTNGRPLTPSTIVSVSAFHLALRTFMAREDYAAAFIVVHALHAFAFRPNLQTYLIVLVPLLDRMKREANLPRPEDTYRLVDFLAHFRHGEDPDLRTLIDQIEQDQPLSESTGTSPVGVNTISQLLALGEPTRSKPDDLPSVPTLPGFPTPPRPRSARARAQLVTPSVEMLTGAQEVPEDGHRRVFFSPVPLARILHLALLGELFRKAVHPESWDWKGMVRPILEETAREMVPEGVVRGWEEEQQKGGRGRDGRGGGVLPFAAARMRRRRRGARGGREIAFDFES